MSAGRSVGVSARQWPDVEADFERWRAKQEAPSLADCCADELAHGKERVLIADVVRRFDGAWHHAAVIFAGIEGLTTSSHGAANRFDWGVTERSIADGVQRHQRYQALADSLTPEQRLALWSDASPQAAVLRRYCR